MCIFMLLNHVTKTESACNYFHVMVINMKNYYTSKVINFKHTTGKTDIYPRMFHNWYEIYLLLNGEVEYINNQTRQTLQPLQLVIIPPGVYHQFNVTGNIDAYERCVIDISPDIFDTGVLDTALSHKELLTLTKNDRIILNFLYLSEAITETDKSDFAYILSAVAIDIIFLIKRSSKVNELNGNSISPLSVNLMRYIDAHYMEVLNLDKLSNEFHFSKSSLCHIFKKDFGISIKQYILTKRINAANLALQKGNAPEKVSMMTGFSNYSSFYRAYRKHYGFAPSDTIQ